MSSCAYMYYNTEEKYFPKLYCKIDGKQCIYAKRCNVEEKFIPNGDLWNECYKRITAQINDIPKGSYYVKTSIKNKFGKLFLYVVIGDIIEKISTDFDSINQDYVFLKKTQNGYIVSLKPFREERKRTNKK